MHPDHLAAAEAARGFMPPDEGRALHDAALAAVAAVPHAPMLEIGSYCGKSAIYLGSAAAAADTVLFAVDHHRGSEENQPGWEWHEPDLVDPACGRIDTLASFRRTIHDSRLAGAVAAGGAPAAGHTGPATGLRRGLCSWCILPGPHWEARVPAVGRRRGRHPAGS